MEFHFGMTKQFWSWRVGMVIQQCECTWCYQTVHLKLVKTGNSVLGIVYHNLKAKQNTVSASEVRDHSREEARQLLGAGLDRLAGLIAPQVAAEVNSSLPWCRSHRCSSWDCTLGPGHGCLFCSSWAQLELVSQTTSDLLTKLQQLSICLQNQPN